MRKQKTDADTLEYLALNKKQEGIHTEVSLVPEPTIKNSCKFERKGWKTPCGSVYIELEYKGNRLMAVRCFPNRHPYPRKNLNNAS